MTFKPCLRPGCDTLIDRNFAFCRDHFDSLPSQLRKGMMEALNRRDKIAFRQMAGAGLKFYCERETT